MTDASSSTEDSLSRDNSGGEHNPSSVASALPPRRGTDRHRRSSARHVFAGRRVSRESSAGRIHRKIQRSHRRHARRCGSTTRSSGLLQTHIASPGQPTGWTAMAHAVRNFDEEKVKDCKEDLDTLLVFAGLFSAVLTAFLIESYKNLLEDPATQTLLAIRQLVAQTASYQVQGGLLNSTAPSLVFEPFQASTLDIRVNVLWFASLLFSLITASFGILVKQWLREFLAAENPSPLARLRVRHLRYPQLARWKVFEIAAVLPLLLQLALALFFAGLCYFTASVHSSVEHTTFPLVFGWAFCFCSVTVLPLIIPRCPYRTALLKGWVQRLHRKLSSAAKSVADYYHPALPKSAPSGHMKPALDARIENVFEYVSRLWAEQDEARAMQLREKDMEILASVDSIQSNDELLGTAIAEAVGHLHCEPLQLEQFLRTIMENRGHRSGKAVYIPRPRDGAYIRPFPLPILDLKLVSKQARNAICTVVSHYASNICSDIDPVDNENEWAVEREVYKTVLMCAIMLSVSDCPVPESVLFILRGARFNEHGWHEMCLLLREALDTVDENAEEEYGIHEDKPGLLLRGLCQLWDALDCGTITLLQTVRQAMAEYARSYSSENRCIPLTHRGLESEDCRCVPLVEWVEVDDWNLDHLSPKQKCDFMGLLIHGMASVLRNGPRRHPDEEYDLDKTFRAILRLSYSAGNWHCDPSDELIFDFILTALLADNDSALFFVDSLVQAPFPWIYALTVRFPDRLATFNPLYGVDIYAIDWCTLLHNFTAAVAVRLSDDGSGHPMSNVDALKLCYFASSLARFLLPAQPSRESWFRLFNMLLDRVDSASGNELHRLNKAKARISDHMLIMISTAEGYGEAWTPPEDSDDAIYEKWANAWKDGDAIFPDRLIECMAPFAPKSRTNTSWRVRRALVAMRAKGSVEQACPSPCTCGPDEWDDAPVIHSSEARLEPYTPHEWEIRGDCGTVFEIGSSI